MFVRPESRPSPPRSTRALRLSLLAAGFLAAPLHAQSLSQAVIVGDQPIPAAQVDDALSQCAAHQPNLAPRTCLDRFWVPRWLIDAEVRAKNLGAAPGQDHNLADILHAQLVAKIATQLAPPT